MFNIGIVTKDNKVLLGYINPVNAEEYLVADYKTVKHNGAESVSASSLSIQDDSILYVFENLLDFWSIYIRCESFVGEEVRDVGLVLTKFIKETDEDLGTLTLKSIISYVGKAKFDKLYCINERIILRTKSIFSFTFNLSARSK
jgi:hypothetical protein